MLFKKIPLWLQILIGLILGLLYGLYLTEYVTWVAWMGEVFIRALMMIIIPLVFASIISGIVQIGSAESLGKLGLKTIFYYISTSILAILTGLFLVNLIKPGIGADLGFVQEVEGLAAASGDLKQTLIEIIPRNIFHALAEQKMLSIIFFAIIFGIFITQVPKKHQTTLKDFFEAVFEVFMKLTMFIIKLTPIGIFGIIANVTAEQIGDPAMLVDTLRRLGLYSLTVLSGLAIHALITIPLLLMLIGRINPWRHFRAVNTPLLTAFSTSSAGATLPLTLEAVEYNEGVPNRITSFTLPLGATINMDGTALYECVAAMFIAQAYGLEMSFTTQAIVVITALLASIGAAAIPMAGLVMISVILTAIGLPLEGVGLILAVDRLLDMFRTSVNVWSDTSCTVIIAKRQGEVLKI